MLGLNLFHFTKYIDELKLRIIFLGLKGGRREIDMLIIHEIDFLRIRQYTSFYLDLIIR